MSTWDLKETAGSIPLPPHPFYPPELNLAGYLANDWNIPTLLAVFAACGALVLGTTHLIISKVNPSLQGWNRALVLWFVLCELNSGR